MHFGPLFDNFKLTLEPGERTEAAGPLFYSENKETQKTWALPPLFSYTRDQSTDFEEVDFGYPIITYDRYGEQYRFQIFQLFSFAGGPTQQEVTRNRFTLFPIYFQLRSSGPKESYTAWGPFYGHLKNRLLRDEIFYIMFPLYSETRKKDVVTDNYLYPFFHLRHGQGLHGWQFFPLTGHEQKEITTTTNGFGETEVIGGHEKFFALWPFFANQTTGIGTTNRTWNQEFLPVYSLSRSANRDVTTVGWPFFSFIEDREKKYHEWQGPWPFVVFARGEGKTTTRFWPLFSRSHNATIENNFYLWPVYKYNRIHSDPLDRRRTRIMFFLYSDILSKNTETGAALRRVDFWPFFTFRREYNGNTRLQCLAVLEPYAPGSHKFERDYSPIWSFWRQEHNPKAGLTSQSLLWNLYRHETAPDSKNYSVLFGLFQYHSGAQGKSVRVLHIPFGHHAPGAEKSQK